MHQGFVPITRQELDAWLVELDTHPDDQRTIGSYHRHGRCYCAIGLLGKAIGDSTCGSARFSDLAQWLCELHTGDFDTSAFNILTTRSDQGRPFKDIAVWVRDNIRAGEMA